MKGELWKAFQLRMNVHYLAFRITGNTMRVKEFFIRPATNSDGPAIKKLVFSSLIEHGLRPEYP
jgi:hypothetical protein